MKRTAHRFLILLLCFVMGCGNGVTSGDRVLVAKFMYDSGVASPNRFDVVVFRFPKEPIQNGVATNYIKRLIGLAGETIAIFFGRLFTYSGITYPEDQDPAKVRPLDLWQHQYMHVNDTVAGDLFKQGKFQIVRKKPAVMLALRRIVYDHDFQPKDLKGILPSRWQPAEGGNWNTLGEAGFQHSGQGAAVDWLRYQHILRPDDWPADDDRDYRLIVEQIKKRKHRSQLITDFSEYNSYELEGQRRDLLARPAPQNWVGDLMLECQVKVNSPQGEFWMELAKGVDRFQARWDLQKGLCTLVRLKDGAAEETLGSTASINRPGIYQLRFANVDERLTVWVNGSLPFGDGVVYPRAWSYDARLGQFINTGPTAHDLKPASLASKGAAVEVRHLKLYRDTYYTVGVDGGGADAQLPPPEHPPDHLRDESSRHAWYVQWWANYWSDPKEWDALRRLPVSTMYVQPGHYLCLGDNSPESSDSRSWGTVPQRLLLGRAVGVYWPPHRLGIIR